MEYKNIDRLFQERFKDFEVQPNPKVWEDINKKLTKKKHRVLPVWWFGGVASLFIAALLTYPFFTKNKVIKSKENTTIVPQNKNNLINSKNIIVVSTNTSNEKVADLVDKKNASYNKDIKELKKLKNNQDKIAVKKIDLAIENTKYKNLTQQKKKINKSKKSLIAEVKKDSILSLNKKDLKWSVQPVFGVVNSGAFSGDSPIDSSLKGGTISGSNTISYGVNVSLQLNKKWAIQSGFHLQQTEYNTQNLAIISSTEIINIIQNITRINNINFTIESLNNVINASYDLSSQNIVSNNATLNQTYSYFEIPLEIKYNLLNKDKFTTNLIGGFSTLILNKNEVSIASETINEFLGSVTNLNTINFSGNFGIDLNYIFDKNWQLNLTPMFKAQLNTFSSNSGNFKPFNIGVYSGIKYQF